MEKPSRDSGAGSWVISDTPGSLKIIQSRTPGKMALLSTLTRPQFFERYKRLLF